MKDEVKRKCPECKKIKLERVFGVPMIFMKGEPQTIGHWAERNTEQMGRYELGDQRGKQQEANKKATEKSSSEVVTRKDIRKMTPEQKMTYIKKGTK
jgi:hypothetical protein